MSNTYRPHEGRLAIVTGSSRGIGAAIATNLASKGANVLLNYTSDSSAGKANELASSLATKHNIKAAAVQADLGSASCGKTIVEAALKHFGNPSSGNLTIHIIVNNAGVSQGNTIETCNAEDFDKQYHVNVRGPLMLVQAALPYLPTDRSGRIVNVSSVSATLSFRSQSVYGGTKAALESMTRTWSRELAARATVNAVNPGPVATDMYGGVSEPFERMMGHFLSNTPGAQVDEVREGKEVVQKMEGKGGRPATPEEIAGVVGMLCSPESQYCNGSTVCANGGMVMTY